jgi:predicted SAM-dependent methyltransferase
MKKNNEATNINLSCGPIYIDNGDWINLDFNSNSTSVKKINLLDTLPFQDESINVVYCSHFVEHIPRANINYFFDEIYRILCWGGGSTLCYAGS